MRYLPFIATALAVLGGTLVLVHESKMSPLVIGTALLLLSGLVLYIYELMALTKPESKQ
jgi:hypothetical protein